MVPSLLARSGKFAATFHGELPAALVQRGADVDAGGEPESTPQRVARGLRLIEDTLLVADRSGGASINLAAKGTAEGGAKLAGHAVLGNDWSQEGFGLIQARELLALGDATLDARGQVKTWRAQVAAKNLAFPGEISARRLALQLDGTAALAETQGQLSLDAVAVGAFTGLDIRTTLTRTLAPAGVASLRARFRAATAASNLSGLAVWTPGTDAQAGDLFTILIPEGQIAAEDVRRALPNLDAAWAQVNGDLSGVLNVADVAVTKDAAGWRAEGAASFSGLQALGLSPHAINPSQDLPFSARFSFVPQRTPYALQLRDVQLASVGGEADLSLEPGGPYVLRLRGELQPSALDQMLGEWWTGAWKLFKTQRRPYATIDVSSHWGDRASEVRGRIRLDDFTFMRAPFRSVEVLVDADAKGTRIGLQRLSGPTPEDGHLDGTAVWDWSKPGPAAGPVVQLQGNLQPWIAATCANPEFGEALRGLRLPTEHTLTLDVRPHGDDVAVHARATCAGAFTAWGIASRGLTLDVKSRQQLDVTADLALADGKAALAIHGDPRKDSKVQLTLKGCDPKKVAKIVEQFELAKPAAPAAEAPAAKADLKTEAPGKLDLQFAGHIDLSHPRLLKGRGNFELTDPDLKRVRLLGGLSTFLEAIGIKATSYDLTQASGQFGCLGGKAYFPDLTFKGPDARLALVGEVDLVASTLEFEGDFSIPQKAGFNPLDYLNINRAFLSLSRVRINGPLANPETSSLAKLSDILKSNKDNKLGKIPPSLLE
jgi:hypothetical protein